MANIPSQIATQGNAPMSEIHPRFDVAAKGYLKGIDCVVIAR